MTCTLGKADLSSWLLLIPLPLEPRAACRPGRDRQLVMLAWVMLGQPCARFTPFPDTDMDIFP